MLRREFLGTAGIAIGAAALASPTTSEAVQSRIHAPNTQTREGLAAMPHVTLHTPMAAEYSSGLVCFDVAGVKPDEVVKRMHNKGIVMSSTP